MATSPDDDEPQRATPAQRVREAIIAPVATTNRRLVAALMLVAFLAPLAPDIPAGAIGAAAVLIAAETRRR